MSGARRERPELSIVLAVPDREREQALLRELGARSVSVVARCLDAAGLVEQGERSADAALVSADLHRLSPEALVALRERGLPVVLLTARSQDVGRYGEMAYLVPADASAEEIASALGEAAARGVADLGTRAGGARPAVARAAPGSGDEGVVIAVTSGKGAPGKTTIAIALADALAGRGRRVALVDADLRGGDVAYHLDVDARRGLVMLGRPRFSAEQVARELQVGPGFDVLAGLERAELGAAVRPEALHAAVVALRERYERVVVDLASLDGASPGRDALLRMADRVLLVTGADVVSLANARAALAAAYAARGGEDGRIGLVVNRRDVRAHYEAEEIAEAFGVPVLGIVREHRAAAHALEARLPLPAVAGGADLDVRALAARVDGETAAAAGAVRPWLDGVSRAWRRVRRGR